MGKKRSLVWPPSLYWPEYWDALSTPYLLPTLPSDAQKQFASLFGRSAPKRKRKVRHG